MTLLSLLFGRRRSSGKVHPSCMIPPPPPPKIKTTEGASPDEMAQLIEEITDDLREMLLAKNAAYGNAASDPLRVFSKCETVEMINVRMDDKLSRMARGSNAGEDAEWDLMGYLVLKRCILRSKLKKANTYASKP